MLEAMLGDQSRVEECIRVPGFLEDLRAALKAAFR